MLVGCGGKGEGSTGASRAPLRIAAPGALALDAAGRLYVADRMLHRVVRIDLASGSRRVVVRGIRDIVALALTTRDTCT
jgi:hypothetical protein